MTKLGCAFVFTSLLAFAYAANDYVLMIDAGSSGSRLYIYQWPQRTDNQIPVVTQLGNRNKSPGISTFARNNNYSGIPYYLEDLIKYARDNLDPSVYANTSIFLKATAGMRLLSPEQQNETLEQVRTTFANSVFKYENASQAEVISGEYEGIYAWVCSNYLLGNIQSQSNYTVGTLDLGGASTQITYNPDPVYPLQGNATIRFTNGAAWTLYSHSYLNYGNDQARLYVSEQLATGLPSGSTVSNPCFPTGYSFSLTASNGNTYIIEGGSNFTACREATIEYLNKNASCPVPQCAFNSVYQPLLNLDQDYIAVSSYFFTYRFFGLASNATLEQLAVAADAYCAMDINQQNTTSKGDSFFLTNCFAGTYIISLLHEGYGFPMNFSRFTMTSKINNVDVGWILGAALTEIDALPFTYPNSTNTTTSTSSSVTSATSSSTATPTTGSSTATSTSSPAATSTTGVKLTSSTSSDVSSAYVVLASFVLTCSMIFL